MTVGLLHLVRLVVAQDVTQLQLCLVVDHVIVVVKIRKHVSAVVVELQRKAGVRDGPSVLLRRNAYLLARMEHDVSHHVVDTAVITGLARAGVRGHLRVQLSRVFILRIREDAEATSAQVRVRAMQADVVHVVSHRL